VLSRPSPLRSASPRPAAAALAPPGAAELVGGLALGEGHQQPPEVVAVVEPGEAAFRGGAAEAVEGAERRVLPVGDDGRDAGAAEPPVGQAHEPLEVAPPDGLDDGGVAPLQVVDPASDGAIVVGRHRIGPHDELTKIPCPRSGPSYRSGAGPGIG
jgi:hypothetical protein